MSEHTRKSALGTPQMKRAQLQVAALRTEIEQLRTELAEARCERDERQAKFEAACQEAERLRSALHWTAQYCLDQACVRRAMQMLEHGGRPTRSTLEQNARDMTLEERREMERQTRELHAEFGALGQDGGKT